MVNAFKHCRETVLSGMKNGKPKSENIFNVENDPLITFRSKSITQTGPTTFDVHGDFTIRGVTKTETLMLVVTRAGTGRGTINGTMALTGKTTARIAAPCYSGTGIR